MWKSTETTSAGQAGYGMLGSHVANTDPVASARVQVRIIRPDGSYRDVTVAGHFREEHLCSLVDDELCRLADGETLTVHLFHADSALSRSLRDRWQEGLSDNRQLAVREVLGPTEDPNQVAIQLRSISRRMATGEQVNLAIRSPAVARIARRQLRKLLLVSQRAEEPILHVWVHGNEGQQDQILDQLESIGVVRSRDFDRFVQQHPERRWRAPWMDVDGLQTTTRRRRPRRQRPTAEDAVKTWIHQVEKQREQLHHSNG